MKNLIWLCMAMFAAVQVASAGSEYELTSAPQSAADWQNGSFYVGGKAPNFDGTEKILLPQGMIAKVDDDSIALVSALDWIMPQQGDSVLEITLSNDATLGTKMYYSDSAPRGKLVKKGPAQLTLSSRLSYNAYYTDIDVQEGTLFLGDRGTIEEHYYGHVHVAEGALLLPCATLGSSTKNSMVDLSGGGTVSNGLGASSLFLGNGDGNPVEFSGRLADNVQLYVQGYQCLTGANSNYRYNTCIRNLLGTGGYGVVGAKRFGSSSDIESSLGLGSKSICFLDNGGRIVYLGDGETSDRKFQVCSASGDAGRPAVLDGGAFGGLTLTGEILPCGDDGGYYVERLWLDGSNSTECVFAGTLPTYKNDKMFLTKTGTGTWRLTDINRSGIAGVAVREGVLALDSIAEKGVACSIGDGSVWTTDRRAKTSAERELVPYQFLLGTAMTEGTLAYTGKEEVYLSTRPIALAGDGVIKNAGTNITLTSGVTSVTENPVTLALDNDTPYESVISTITNGMGTVAVEKRGTGDWIIDGTNNNFTGGISVKAGKLVLRGLGGFKWYRWTVRDLRNSEKSPMTLGDLAEFAMFDKDGMRVDKGLTLPGEKWTSALVDPESYRSVVKKGNMSFGRAYPYVNNISGDSGHSLGLFDGLAGASSYFFITVYTNATPGAGANWKLAKPHPDYPDTWFSIVMHHSDEANEPVTYDWACWGPGTLRNPVNWLLEGSHDGVTWYEVDNVVNGPTCDNAHDYSFQWAYKQNGTAGADGISWGEPGDPHFGGRAFMSISNALPVVYSGPVSVASGAVLEARGKIELNALAVDPDDAGTIRNVSFARSGALDVTSRMPGGGDLPLILENVTGLENIADWEVTVEGKRNRATVSVTADGKLHITVRGLAIIVR